MDEFEISVRKERLAGSGMHLLRRRKEKQK